MNKNKRLELGLLACILLLAALLRLWALDDAPPGLEHDEVANWLIARDILSGHHAIYFSAAYGHEALWQYVQAGTVALLGDNWLGLRSASVLLGLLGIFSAYLLARRLFGPAIALGSAAWLAVSFWHIFYSRIALRAISLPALSALGAYFLWRVISGSSRTTLKSASISVNLRPIDAILAGLFFGLSAYTYMAARALPFILAGLVLYLALFQRPTLRRAWRGLALTLLIAAIVAAPLAHWLLTHPGAEQRIGEVSEPLDRLLAGDPAPALDNALALLKMWSIQGDPWDRQNVPGRPVFVEPLGALLFYAGLLVALWRVRRPEYGFILIWLAGSLIPSLITSVAPSSIRTINALAVVYIFPGIGILGIGELGIRKLGSRELGSRELGTPELVRGRPQQVEDSIHRTPELVRGRPQQVEDSIHRTPERLDRARRGLVRGRSRQSVHSAIRCSIIALILALNLYLTARDYFVRWPADAGVQFVFQTGLTAIARDLDNDPDDSPVAVAGLSVDTMDPPTFAATLRRKDLDVRWFDAREALLIPGGPSNSRLLVPHIVPIAAPLQARLAAWGATATPLEHYTRYDISADQADLSALTTTTTLPGGEIPPSSALFGGQIKLEGYEWVQSSAQTSELLTYWRVVAAPAPPLKIFVHLVPVGGASAIAQNDGLGSPPDSWQPGDLLIRRHTLTTPPPGLYQPQIGWYNPQTNARLPILSDGEILADHLLLKPLEISAP